MTAAVKSCYKTWRTVLLSQSFSFTASGHAFTRKSFTSERFSPITSSSSSSSKYLMTKRQVHNHAGAEIPYFSMYNQARDDPSTFWAAQAKEIPWYNEPTHSNILDASNPPFYKWYTDGVMNTSYCCLDHHVKNGRSDQVALIHHCAYGDYGGDITKSVSTKYTYSHCSKNHENQQ